MVSGHLHAATVALGDPVWGAVAGFVRSHATVGVRARERALTIAERNAELLEPDDGPAGQVYGMLHLSAALQSAVTGRPDSARAHLTEAPVPPVHPWSTIFANDRQPSTGQPSVVDYFQQPVH